MTYPLANLAAALATAFFVNAAAAADPIIINNAVTPGDACVQDTVSNRAEPFMREGKSYEIGGEEFEKIKRNCEQSHGPLSFEKDQTGKIVVPLFSQN